MVVSADDTRMNQGAEADMFRQWDMEGARESVEQGATGGSTGWGPTPRF